MNKKPIVPKKVQKPIIGKRTTLGQALDEMLKETFPINYWCNQNKK
jgi:hypothetical protein